MLPKELDIMKRKTKETIKADWRENTGQRPSRGGCPGKGRSEIVDPGAYTEEVFDRQQPDFQKASDADPKQGLTSMIATASFTKHWPYLIDKMHDKNPTCLLIAGLHS